MCGIHIAYTSSTGSLEHPVGCSHHVWALIIEIVDIMKFLNAIWDVPIM